MHYKNQSSPPLLDGGTSVSAAGEGHQLISKAAIKRVTCGEKGMWLQALGTAQRRGRTWVFIYSTTGGAQGANREYWLYVALMKVSI